MKTEDLIEGAYYMALPNEYGLRVPVGMLKYVGPSEILGETKHIFWDEQRRLSHWIEPEKIEPVHPKQEE